MLFAQYAQRQIKGPLFLDLQTTESIFAASNSKQVMVVSVLLHLSCISNL